MSEAHAHAHAHAHHFESLAHQERAARLGVWVFLSSETLLFAGLFGLYAAYRMEFPATFHEGIAHMAHVLGAVNTFLLLTSSLTAALSIPALRLGRRKLAAALVGVTVLFGVAFLGIKAVEYAAHIREGMTPVAGDFSMRGHPSLVIFSTLYFMMTGLHALHVLAGVTVLAWIGRLVFVGRLAGERAYPLELGVLYWHLVDAVWVFLWPLFYLTGGHHP